MILQETGERSDLVVIHFVATKETEKKTVMLSCSLVFCFFEFSSNCHGHLIRT